MGMRGAWGGGGGGGGETSVRQRPVLLGLPKRAPGDQAEFYSGKVNALTHCS